VLDQLAHYIKDPRVLNLIGQYLGRCAERGGLYWEYTKGIALCFWPLSLQLTLPV